MRFLRLPEFLLLFLLLGLDRATKVVVAQTMHLYQSIPVVPGFFSLTYLRNTGAAFSLGAGWDSPLRRVFFIAVSLAALAVLAYIYRKAKGGPLGARLALAGIAAGALGNLYDRVVFGEVVDFFDVFVGTRHWPAFNIADSAISCGAVALFVLNLTGRFDWPEKARDEGKREG